MGQNAYMGIKSVKRPPYDFNRVRNKSEKIYQRNITKCSLE